MRIAGFGFNTPPLSGSNQSLIKFLKNQNQSSGFTITIPAGSRSLWLDFKWISGTPTISAEWTVTHAVILDSTLITDGNPILLDLQSIISVDTDITVTVAAGEINSYLAYVNYDI